VTSGLRMLYSCFGRCTTTTSTTASRPRWEALLPVLLLVLLSYRKRAVAACSQSYPPEAGGLQQAAMPAANEA
jgi:hypothetical protein